MNKEILKMSKEELEERTKELLQIDQVDLILKYLYQEQKINKTIEYIEKQLEDTKKCLEYAREYHNLNDTEKYTRDFNLYTILLDILKGDNNDK